MTSGPRVDCPVLWEPMPLDTCRQHQAGIGKHATDPLRLALRAACPGCPHNLSHGRADLDPVAILNAAKAELGSWAAVARRLDYHRSTISLRANGKYERDTTALDACIREVFGGLLVAGGAA